MNLEWVRFSEKKPTKEGKYFTCDQYGKITIKKYEKVWRDKNGGLIVDPKQTAFCKSDGQEAKNVFYWMEIPMPPTVDNDLLVKLEAKRREKEKILTELKEIERQLRGNVE